jgi:hypothetical protein
MNDDIKHIPAKVASAAGIWVTGMTWGEIAQMMAALYTSCLVLEWLWKRVLKPLAQRMGWLKPKGQPSEFLDSTGAAPLGDK